MIEAENIEQMSLETIETNLFLEGIYYQYGYDFRQYAQSSMLRRLRSAMEKENVTSISQLQDRVLHNSSSMDSFIRTMSVNVTSLFRNPGFYVSFRKKVIPLLRTYPFIRIWIAGCSSGEEVYSMAILLKEENLYDRSRIYATDMSSHVLQKAKEGIFPLDKMRDYTTNYQQAGGKEDFSKYYTSQYENVIFRSDLKEQLVFSQHNLATDGVFNEFHIILCRNVLIYFNKKLQEKVFTTFYNSLCSFGILALGKKESLRFSGIENNFEPIHADDRIYRRLQ